MVSHLRILLNHESPSFLSPSGQASSSLHVSQQNFSQHDRQYSDESQESKLPPLEVLIYAELVLPIIFTILIPCLVVFVADRCRSYFGSVEEDLIFAEVADQELLIIGEPHRCQNFQQFQEVGPTRQTFQAFSFSLAQAGIKKKIRVALFYGWVQWYLYWELWSIFWLCMEAQLWFESYLTTIYRKYVVSMLALSVAVVWTSNLLSRFPYKIRPRRLRILYFLSVITLTSWLVRLALIFCLDLGTNEDCGFSFSIDEEVGMLETSTINERAGIDGQRPEAKLSSRNSPPPEYKVVIAQMDEENPPPTYNVNLAQIRSFKPISPADPPPTNEGQT